MIYTRACASRVVNESSQSSSSLPPSLRFMPRFPARVQTVSCIFSSGGDEMHYCCCVKRLDVEQVAVICCGPDVYTAEERKGVKLTTPWVVLYCLFNRLLILL